MSASGTGHGPAGTWAGLRPRHDGADGVALGVATLGTLYLTLQPHSFPHAFATVEYIQMGIVVLLAIGAAALPRFTTASAETPVVDA
ncbi:hypothetical protein [Pseudofrankia sp. BMG5.36]|uniref:hypothetical protein n=1 Tax=Pseudofrankia sp. BMG5.36 TaxID=1834512 RepID=UPI0008D9B117|nr:hypothetical protein [Pseudofrankia sp. BMG5.36]OHV45557.1 hypothetical protein BCD48_22515 [Pseudofrankia sp. BMG5.36]